MSFDDCYRGPSSRIQLNAATGGAGPLPVITTLLSRPITIVDVTIDTRKMRNPSVLLTYTSILNLPAGITVTLNHEVVRSSQGGTPVPVGSTFTFAQFLPTVLEAESFSFQYFDNNVAPGVYTYTVELSTNSIIDITPGLTINNATLSALAVDNGPF